MNIVLVEYLVALIKYRNKKLDSSNKDRILYLLQENVR